MPIAGVGSRSSFGIRLRPEANKIQARGKHFFSEEKKQKTFENAVADLFERAGIYLNAVAVLSGSGRHKVKVFWFFVSTKNYFPCLSNT